MEFDPNPTIQEILDELNKTTEGKTQLELAALRAVVAKQQAFIVQSNEASPPRPDIAVEDVSMPDDTDD